MFSTADFGYRIVGHADPWKQRWFLSRFSTSNCTFDDMPQGVSGAMVLCAAKPASPTLRQAIRIRNFIKVSAIRLTHTAR
jgi:hypothetical protein